MPHTLSLNYHCSAKDFFTSRRSEVLGYIPIISTPIGISRIAFNIVQFYYAPNSDLRQRALFQIGRGVFETFSLGLINAIYDLFISRVDKSNPYLSHFAVTPAAGSTIDHHLNFLSVYFSRYSKTAMHHYAHYRSSGEHAWKNQTLFYGADFLTRHGMMHASSVALFVPLFVSLYRELGLTAHVLTTEEIADLQIVAFFHDFGRFVKGQDLGSDHGEVEAIGAEACAAYLQAAKGYDVNKARKLSQIMLRKDDPLSYKTHSEEILQNCDCLAVLRADDWIFDEKFLNLRQRIEQKITDPVLKAQALENLHQVIDEAKKWMISLGDSPYDKPAVSQKYQGQILKGSFSLDRKRQFETHPHCYTLMRNELVKHPHLVKFSTGL